MSRMQIKIPRDIERRKASPDMDLYRCLVTLLPEGIEILTREALVEAAACVPDETTGETYKGD